MGELDLCARARDYGHTLRGLADLVDKYRALAGLRAGEPGRTVTRRDAMRAISTRFPGALREYDQTSEGELERRAQETERMLGRLVDDLERQSSWMDSVSPGNVWMRAAAELHPYLREVLKVKRWLGGRAPTPDVLAAFAAWHAECGDPRWMLAHWDATRLDWISAPPQGQVTQVVYDDVATRYGVTADALRSLMFPGDDETRRES